jgi:hypothetical protein
MSTHYSTICQEGPQKTVKTLNQDSVQSNCSEKLMEMILIVNFCISISQKYQQLMT